MKQKHWKRGWVFSAILPALIVLAVAFGAVGPANASVGYCTECGCGRFDKDVFASSGNNWFCCCGHHYDRHCFSDRPVSFGGSRYGRSEERKGFFDDGMNIVWTICAVLSIIAMCVEKRTAGPAAVGLYFFVRALLKYWGVL